MKANVKNFKKDVMQLCIANDNLLFISKEDWSSDEIKAKNYNIEFFDVVKIEEVGWNKNFPSELFFDITLENGDILNIAGNWYDDDTINISYQL